MLRLIPFLAGPAALCGRPTSAQRRWVRRLSHSACRTKRPWAFVALAVTYLGAASGCDQKNEYQPPPPPTVTVSRPVRQTVVDYLEETGTTEAVERVEIRARVTGFLEKVNFEPSQLVEAGQPLYVIEQRPFQATADAARAKKAQSEAQFKLAEAELGRAKQLIDKGVLSTSEFEVKTAEMELAKAQVEVATAALEQADIELGYTTVTAPFAGRVSKTLVKAGNLVDGVAATPLTTVIKYDPIYANFNISERALLAIREESPREAGREVDKQKVRFYLQRASDKGFPFEGRLDFWDLAVDQSTGTYAVRGIFPNPDLDIVPGLFVRIRVPIRKLENALLVPERAVGADQAGKFVLVVNSEGTVERRDVTLGTKVEDFVVVLTGLQADDRVVTDGVQRARPGAKVQPEQKPLEPPEQERPTEAWEARPDAAEEAAGRPAAPGNPPAAPQKARTQNPASS